MELPPPHVLAQLDAIIVGQESIVAITEDLQTVDEDDDRSVSSEVAPDPARAPTEATSKYWGVHWHKRKRRWQASYHDANGKHRSLGSFDTQEAAAHAVNSAIRRAGLEGKRHTNPVVDGQLVPKPPRKPSSRKRRREDAPVAGASASRSRQE